MPRLGSPHIDMYLDEADAGALLAWLNDQDEIAFVVPGSGTPKHTERISELKPSEIRLWHRQAAVPPAHPPLTPELEATRASLGGIAPALVSHQPMFGDLDETHPTIFHLGLWHRVDGSGGFELSGLGWIGDRYTTPPAPTSAWWARCRTWIEATATRVARGDTPLDEPLAAGLWAWAFPHALRAIEAGATRALNPS